MSSASCGWMEGDFPYNPALLHGFAGGSQMPHLHSFKLAGVTHLLVLVKMLNSLHSSRVRDPHGDLTNRAKLSRS